MTLVGQAFSLSAVQYSGKSQSPAEFLQRVSGSIKPSGGQVFVAPLQNSSTSQVVPSVPYAIPLHEVPSL